MPDLVPISTRTPVRAPLILLALALPLLAPFPAQAGQGTSIPVLPSSTPTRPLPPQDSGFTADTVRWRWAPGTGIGLHQMREDLVAPLRYVGPTLDLRLSGEQHRAAGERRVQIHAGAAFGANRHGHHAAALSFGGSYRHLWRVSPAWLGEETRLMLGAAAVTRTDDMYYYDWDDGHLYWSASHGVGPAALLLRNRREGRTLALSLEVPVVGLVGRPDPERRRQVDDLVLLRTWITGPSRDTRFALVPDLLVLDGRLDYQTSQRFRWTLDLSLHTTPDPVRTVVLRHMLGGEWRPGR